MRVIAGAFRGRQLRAPSGTATRPTGDRVREAIFDILGSLVDLQGMVVVDLYAGSGAMGIEALSRGAAQAVFVEQASEAIAVIGDNLAALGLAGRAQVVRADVLTWLRGHHEADLALCDPPYR
ncbi:MAG: 16S rRNA (guanine(966)-N(2))-methyltransferase RsmD, partial [Acidimicrobiales bacterium]